MPSACSGAAPPGAEAKGRALRCHSSCASVSSLDRSELLRHRSASNDATRKVGVGRLQAKRACDAFGPHAREYVRALGGLTLPQQVRALCMKVWRCSTSLNAGCCEQGAHISQLVGTLMLFCLKFCAVAFGIFCPRERACPCWSTALHATAKLSSCHSAAQPCAPRRSDLFACSAQTWLCARFPE